MVRSIGLDGHRPPRLRLRPLRRPPDRHPVPGRRRATPSARASRFEYADESDKGPYPIPRSPQIEGGGDRHILLVQRGTCRLFELFAAERRGSALARRAAARSSTCARTSCARAAGRAPTPPACRSSRASPATTRSPRGEIRHALRFTVVAHARRVRLPRAPLRVLAHRPRPARDGPAVAAEGGVRIDDLPRQARIVATALQALRDDRRRQRLGLVRLRRARLALGQRRPARARTPARAATSRSSVKSLPAPEHLDELLEPARARLGLLGVVQAIEDRVAVLAVERGEAPPRPRGPRRARPAGRAGPRCCAVSRRRRPSGRRPSRARSRRARRGASGPRSISASTLPTLIFDHFERARRGVYFCRK